MEKKDLKALAMKLMFNVDEQVLAKLNDDYDMLENKINEMHKVDVSGLEPLVRIDESEFSYLREDEPGQTLSLDDVLDNAPTSKDSYITIKKVVGND